MALVRPRLGEAALATLPANVRRPGYDRSALQAGILHLGIGAFMRAHLAVATEGLGWGITGVSLRSPDTRDALEPQQGLYTLAVRSAAGQQLQVIGAVQRVLVAQEQPQAVLDAIASAATRILSLTVTEKGYLPGDDTSTLGWLVRGLAQRRAQGSGGLTLMSLDNMPANGKLLRQRLLAQAGTELGEWIASHCSFPCSMVDRIVPRTTEGDRVAVASALACSDAWPVLAEPFFDWVVEDRFVAGRPAWEQAGVRFVDDAAPWETLKLRMVNASHSAIAYLGSMAGWTTVDQAIAQPMLHAFINALMREEVAPTLPALPGLDLDIYRRALLQRFANPALAHRTQQIAMDGSQKLPQRLVATLAQRQVLGLASPRLLLALAAWLHYLRGHDEAMRPYPIDDPLAGELSAWLGRVAAQGSPLGEAQSWLGFAPVFGALKPDAALAAQLAQALAALRQQGVAATLAHWG